MARAESGRAGRVILATLITTAGITLAARPARAQEPTADQIAQGKEIFTGKTCWGCHGKDAKGTSNAPPLVNKKAWLDADGSWASIEQTVTTGVPKPKKFKVAMPPMGGSKLSPEEVKAVAAYVYSLNHPSGGKGK
jgi:mono/diheme cytochrome c family protein